MLEKALQATGYKEEKGERKKIGKTSPLGKAEKQKGELCPDTSTKITNPGRGRQKSIWLDISECSSKGDLGLLKYGVVGR